VWGRLEGWREELFEEYEKILIVWHIVWVVSGRKRFMCLCWL